jgi:hypothetical protein
MKYQQNRQNGMGLPFPIRYVLHTFLWRLKYQPSTHHRSPTTNPIKKEVRRARISVVAYGRSLPFHLLRHAGIKSCPGVLIDLGRVAAIVMARSKFGMTESYLSISYFFAAIFPSPTDNLKYQNPPNVSDVNRHFG